MDTICLRKRKRTRIKYRNILILLKKFSVWLFWITFFFLLKDYFLKVKWKYLSYLFSSLKNISNSIETKLSSVSDFNFFWGKFYLFTMPLLYNSVQLFRQRPQHHCGLAPVFLNLSLYTSSFVLGQEILNSRYSFSKQLWFLNNKK